MNQIYKPFQPTLTETGLRKLVLSLQYSLPNKRLIGVVHSYLQVSTANPTPYPVLPDGSQAIFISPQGVIVGGAQTLARDIPMLYPGEYFGIRFYPGVLRHFFDLNLSEITEQFVDQKYIPCPLFDNLHNQIYECPKFHARAQVCEQWLLRHFNPVVNTPFDQALTSIYQSFGNIRIDQLARKVGWSSRHLNRLFRLNTGLSTKTFSQTVRIQHACRQLYLNPESSLKTAGDLGFFDQAHLLNDFKKRLSASPSVLFDRFKSDFYNNQAL